jgi:hypothetical protein
MRLTDVIDRFWGRYAHQIESLDLSNFNKFSTFVLHLPFGFWAQLTVLRLLAFDYETLNWKGWWSVAPPPTHPCRYLVCRIEEYHVSDRVTRAIDDIITKMVA